MVIKNGKWLLLISALAIVGFVIISVFNVFETPPPPVPPNFGSQYHDIRAHGIWLSPMLLIIAIIPLSYYFISKRFEEKIERNLKIILKLVSKNEIKPNGLMEVNTGVMLKLLNHNERKIFEKLIEKKGEVMQSEITRMEGMSKLKTHRAIRNLEAKGVIKIERYGKTNRILMSKDIKNELFK